MRFAELPELHMTPTFLPKIAATFDSNSSVLGPGASHPSRRHATTSAISSSPYASNLLGAYQIFLGAAAAATGAAVTADSLLSAPAVTCFVTTPRRAAMIKGR